MQTLSFQAPSEMREQLEHYAGVLDRSKAWLIRQAIEEYLEDLEDYIEAKRYIANHDASENTSFDAIKKKYDLD